MNPSIDTLHDQESSPKPAPALTVAEVRKLIPGWTDLTAGRRQKMMTALSTAIRALVPMQAIDVAEVQLSFDCPSLRSLRAAPPATFGLSAGRMSSLVSELRYVLRRLGLHEPDRRHAPLVDPVLRVQYEALPTERQLAFVDYFRFLDANGIKLDAAGRDTLESYVSTCRDRTLCRDPERRRKQVVDAWNWACQHVQGWPPLLLPAPAGREVFAMSLAALPDSFQEDVRHYVSRLGGQDLGDIFSDDIFGDTGSEHQRFIRVLRSETISSRLYHIRAAAGALARSGIPTQCLRSLRDLVHPPAHPRAILKLFSNRNGGKTGPQLHKLADGLRLIARDYCCLPTDEVEQLAAWAKRMRVRKVKGMTEKNRKRLRALMAVGVRAMLLHMPAHLLKEATALPPAQVQAARLVMYAVALEILLVCPMRRGNLAALRIDQHLHRPDPRKPIVTHIFLGEEEVKNGQALQWPLPAESAKLLATYLTRYRHHLAEPNDPFLFPAGKKGRRNPGEGGRSAQSIATWLSQAVRRYIGVEFNLHLVRHFSAWNFLRQNPGQYEIVRRVLGHSDIKTTINFYLGLEVDAAAQHFDRVVLRDRHATRRTAQQAFRAGRGGLAVRSKKART